MTGVLLPAFCTRLKFVFYWSAYIKILHYCYTWLHCSSNKLLIRSCSKNHSPSKGALGALNISIPTRLPGLSFLDYILPLSQSVGASLLSLQAVSLCVGSCWLKESRDATTRAIADGFRSSQDSSFGCCLLRATRATINMDQVPISRQNYQLKLPCAIVKPLLSNRV